jgi:hypothetical protein
MVGKWEQRVVVPLLANCSLCSLQITQTVERKPEKMTTSQYPVVYIIEETMESLLEEGLRREREEEKQSEKKTSECIDSKTTKDS